MNQAEVKEDKEFYDSSRSLIQILGKDSSKFLQSIVTNDLINCQKKLIYNAILTPVGKYLFDFFVLINSRDELIIDVKADKAKALCERLTLYKLRSDVEIKQIDGTVIIGFGKNPTGSFVDPRHEKLGWRKYILGNLNSSVPPPLDQTFLNSLRVEYCIPETDIELISDQTYILEAGFERLNGVSFKKGCFVGQEVTARMKHKTILKKGLVKVQIIGDLGKVGSRIEFQGKELGSVYTVSGGYALAFLRSNAPENNLVCGEVSLRVVEKFY